MWILQTILYGRQYYDVGNFDNVWVPPYLEHEGVNLSKVNIQFTNMEGRKRITGSSMESIRKETETIVIVSIYQCRSRSYYYHSYY